MQQGWAQAPPAWPRAESGLLKAGKILLLVGSILSAVGAVMMIGMSFFMAAVFSEFAEGADPEAPGFPPTFFLVFYGGWGLLAAAGSVCGFLSWRKATAGDLSGGFGWGIAAGCLPPINVVALLGAIFVKVCPEAEARPAAPAWQAPR